MLALWAPYILKMQWAKVQLEKLNKKWNRKNIGESRFAATM